MAQGDEREGEAAGQTGTAYAGWAPHASIAHPPTADPAEMPTRCR